MTKTIKIAKIAGTFAENKDKARSMRIGHIEPALHDGATVILDFEGVDGVTQSFVHALISEVIRSFGSDVLDRLLFKNCNPTIKQIISIVVDYMQQTDAE